MKTTKISTAIFFVLIFAATSVIANTLGGPSRPPAGNKVITHNVTVTISLEKPLINTYLVQITDGQGNLVAPPQVFVYGVTQYNIYERGPVDGMRVASLVREEYGNHLIAEYELFTTPVSLAGPFLNGHTYRYDLFPSMQPIKD